MRRKEKQITDQDQIDGIIKQALKRLFNRFGHCRDHDVDLFIRHREAGNKTQ